MNPTCLRLGGIALAALFFVCAGSAQSSGDTNAFASYSAPTVWTRYKVPTQQVSVLLPKLPTVQPDPRPCSQSEGAIYHAFADQILYEFRWYAKSEKPFPDYCDRKEKFGPMQFVLRAKELAGQTSTVQTEVKLGTRPAKMFSTELAGSTETRWILWDTDRWFEFSIVRRPDTAVDENRFVASLQGGAAGAEIGSGALRTLGDPTVERYPEIDPKIPNQGIIIRGKPRASYTELARTRNVQGSVMLRVTFLANGGVGSISVVKALEAGLTEQAISAASRISFIPARHQGLPVTVSKQVEYSFSIY